MLSSGFDFRFLLNEWKHNKIAFGLKYLSIVLAFVVIATMPLFTYRSGYNLITNSISILFCALCFLYILLYGNFKFDLYFVPFIIFLIFAFLSCLLTGYWSATLRSIVFLYALCFFFYELSFNAKTYAFLFIGYLTGAFLLALFIFLDNFESIITLSFDRIGGAFGNVNTIGMIFALSVLIAFYFSLFKRRYKLLNVVLVVISFAFVVLSGSRGALFTSVIAILLISFFRFNGRMRIIFILSIIAVAVLCVLLFQLPVFADLKMRIFSSVISLLTGGNSGDASSNQRLMMLEEGLYLWLRSPIFGNGFDSFGRISNQLVYSHSNLSELLSNMGLLGTVIWYLPFFYLVFASRKSRLIVLNLVFLLSAVVLSSFFSVLYLDKPFFVAATALLSACSLNEDQSHFSLELSVLPKPSLRCLLNGKMRPSLRKNALDEWKTGQIK